MPESAGLEVDEMTTNSAALQCATCKLGLRARQKPSRQLILDYKGRGSFAFLSASFFKYNTKCGRTRDALDTTGHHSTRDSHQAHSFDSWYMSAAERTDTKVQPILSPFAFEPLTERDHDSAEGPKEIVLNPLHNPSDSCCHPWCSLSLIHI